MPAKFSSRLFVAALAGLTAIVACSEDDSSDEDTSGTGGSAGTTGGSAGSGNAGSSGGGTGGSGGAAGSGGSSASSGGVSGSGGSLVGGAGGSAVGGSAAGDAAPSDGGPPAPTEAGLSVYSVECSGDSAVCGYPAGHCLGINLPDGGAGFTCSNHCESVADCSSAPTGAEAEPSCVPFRERSRCVLLCNNAGALFDCPAGMNCYTYPGSLEGYCLWL